MRKRFLYFKFDYRCMKFPRVKGNNLEEKPYKLPEDLEGELNLCIIPFKRWQQGLVDEWVPFLSNISEKIEGFRFYEIPTMAKGYRLMSFIIDGGMRSGIPDRSVRKRTITLYINKSPFKNALNILSEDTIYLYLVRRNGEILWNSKGGFDEKVAEDLLHTLENLKIVNQSVS